MTKKEFRKGVFWVGAVDWDRRLFDSLIPLPDGTSYNAYLVRGSEKTALLDAVDPAKIDELEAHLPESRRSTISSPITPSRTIRAGSPSSWRSTPGPSSLHASGQGHAHRPSRDRRGSNPDRLRTAKRSPSGDRTLRFIHTPWVHWPETMSTYLEEDRILFSCDWFGSHLATSELFVEDEAARLSSRQNDISPRS